MTSTALFQPLADRFRLVAPDARNTPDRPLKFVCRTCGAEFYPLVTPGAVANMLAHRCAQEDSHVITRP